MKNWRFYLNTANRWLGTKKLDHDYSLGSVEIPERAYSPAAPRRSEILLKKFEEIYEKTGKSEADVIKLMRKNLKPGSFRLWRKRVHNTSIKHRKKFKLGRKKLREKIKITDIY